MRLRLAPGLIPPHAPAILGTSNAFTNNPLLELVLNEQGIILQLLIPNYSLADTCPEMERDINLWMEIIQNVLNDIDPSRTNWAYLLPQDGGKYYRALKKDIPHTMHNMGSSNR